MTASGHPAPKKATTRAWAPCTPSRPAKAPLRAPTPRLFHESLGARRGRQLRMRARQGRPASPPKSPQSARNTPPSHRRTRGGGRGLAAAPLPLAPTLGDGRLHTRPTQHRPSRSRCTHPGDRRSPLPRHTSTRPPTAGRGGPRRGGEAPRRRRRPRQSQPHEAPQATPQSHSSSREASILTEHGGTRLLLSELQWLQKEPCVRSPGALC